VFDSAVSTFNKLVAAEPPAIGNRLFDTACVLGGSVAGLLAARVLSDHARRVVILERDDVSADYTSRGGTPHDQQVHTLLPAGQHWIERWLPGFTRQAEGLGAVLSTVDTTLMALDGHRQANSGAKDHVLLLASRPFLESRIRARVVALPNVLILRARATGLRYRGDAVSGVRYVGDGDLPGTLEADFVVDAMGRSTRLFDWVGQDGFDRPGLERLNAPINYATALFERPLRDADLEVASLLSVATPEFAKDGVAVAAANAIERDQWLVMLMGYGDDRPGATMDEFRATCAKVSTLFDEVTRGAVTRDIVTYHQEESRRRDFTRLGRYPAGLVSVGDAVASFNPVYGQGMSSAALHASCLSDYLTGGPDLTTAASEFFRLQQVVVDAAWMTSAGGDTARLDAAAGVDVPEDVAQQRWAIQQLLRAGLVDEVVARAFNNVSYMLRHPATLADPALVERAVAANAGASN
jgi:2-polyprenyl-6-methoxyphenol hydroxylase-like FAD-dependent oxidoreductase